MRGRVRGRVREGKRGVTEGERLRRGKGREEKKGGREKRKASRKYHVLFIPTRTQHLASVHTFHCLDDNRGCPLHLILCVGKVTIIHHSKHTCKQYT